MSFTRSTENISVHQQLSDYPNQDDGLSAAELKQRFDYPAEQIQSDLNGLMGQLESTSASASLGAGDMFSGDTSGDTVQDKLNKLYSDIQDIALGTIPDDSITESKLVTTYSSTLAKKQDLGLLYLASKYKAITGGQTPSSYTSPSLTTASPQGHTVTVEEGTTTEISDVYTMFNGSGNERIKGDSNIVLKVEFPNYFKISSISGKYKHLNVDKLEWVKVSGSTDGSTFTEIETKQVPSSFTTDEKTFSLSITNNNYYKYYRLEFGAGSSAGADGNVNNYIYNNLVLTGTTITTTTMTYSLSKLYTNETLTGYTKGMVVKIWTPASTPTGTTIDNKINVYSMGAKTIDKALEPDTRYSLVYDGTKFVEE